MTFFMSRGARHRPSLMFTGLPLLGRSTDETGLAAQKSGACKHIDHRSRRRDVSSLVHYRSAEHAEFTL